MCNLTYVGYFEHLLVVESLLRLDDAWQVDELSRVGPISDVKYCSSRVCAAMLIRLAQAGQGQ